MAVDIVMGVANEIRNCGFFLVSVYSRANSGWPRVKQADPFQQMQGTKYLSKKAEILKHLCNSFTY